ncbi:hypothetical protein EDD85DRAFT_871734 [Armillaria nabsnona]|nr:hypothetical protein EDD85DRAFT_871734 [Armillaria nabsnona]
MFLPGLGNLAHRGSKSSISSHAFIWSRVTIAHTASTFLTTSILGGPVFNILTVNVGQHVCGVDYVGCLPANVIHEPRLAMIPTLELHFVFHRAFMNLYHEQKFGVRRQKETTKARFFNLVRRLVGKGKKTGDSESKGRRLRASFFHAPFDLNDFENYCLL